MTIIGKSSPYLYLHLRVFFIFSPPALLRKSERVAVWASCSQPWSTHHNTIAVWIVVLWITFIT